MIPSDPVVIFDNGGVAALTASVGDGGGGDGRGGDEAAKQFAKMKRMHPFIASCLAMAVWCLRPERHTPPRREDQDSGTGYFPFLTKFSKNGITPLP
jgi:hypothetical protein